MHRRVVVVPILLAAAATGCSTFSDNDAAARVADFELSQDQLGNLLVAAAPVQPGVEPAATTDAGTARDLLNAWILTRILEVDMEAQGERITPEAIADATGALASQDPGVWAEIPADLQTLQVEQRAAVDIWSALPAPTDDDLRALYEAGTQTSGFVCSAQIVVETEDQANDLLARLDDGADFAELAASESIDTASVAAGGALPCDTIGNFETNYAPEFVDAALTAPLGVPVGPVESEFGYHVIVLRPSSDVDASELALMHSDVSLRFQRAARGVDIYVDPRFGTFNALSGVEALG